MLSSDLRLNSLAKKRLEELDRAFEYLTEPKKFRDFHELVNDKLTAGNIEPGSLVASIARGRADSDIAELETGVTAPSEPTGPDGPGRQTATGEAAGLSVESHSGDTGATTTPSGPGGPNGPARGTDVLDFVHTSLAEERELLKELRRKRQEKAPKIGHKRREAIDKLVKDTLAEIEQVANSTARSKASELVARGVTNSDEFFEKVYSAAFEVAKAVREQAIQKVDDKNFPIEERYLDEWEQAVMDRSEEAAEREYNNLEGVMAEQRVKLPTGDRGFMFKLVIVLCTLAGTLIVFCNIDVLLTTNRPDALRQQIKDAGGSDTTSSDISSIMTTIPKSVSANPAIAQAANMAQPAGLAGAAGWSNSLAINGAPDYNAGCKALSAGSYQQAIDFFNRAIERNQDIYQFYYNRALANVYVGNYPAALKDLDSAIALRTDLMQSRYNKGQIYLAGGADCVNQAAKIPEPDNQKLLRQATINLQAAIAEFSVVSNKMPGLAQPVYNRAIARYRLGDLAGAAADFKLAAKLDSNMQAANYNLNTAQKADGKLQGESGVAIPDAPAGPQGPPGPGIF